MYKLSELKQYVEAHGIKIKKGLSQNFLIDGNIIKKILRASNFQKGETVLEIGPGLGALTKSLLDGGAYVIAIEKDKMFANLLEKLQTEDRRLEAIQADILEFSLEEKIMPLVKSSGKKIKLIANLPYHITSPILEKIVPLFSIFESITIMVQKEFAERMFASKDSNQRSSLSIFFQYHATYLSSFSVASSCFFPKPNVDSTVVHFKLKESSPDFPKKEFFSLVRLAFQKRRKMVKSSLKGVVSDPFFLKIFQDLHIPIESRPENLSLEQWTSLFNSLRSCLKTMP
ncbi:MAG: 16S rRNA (adenine(1518)-N(6)/adenine(1519)-N(6))-dimethyltransferase RsmA [Chlamydiae bacterium]|nr:16S rRNA (adenine(1518)-N(6)/adenine(1519)-N(6))-dimethyltransferase RsmA [Chlamydiota bacterium]